MIISSQILSIRLIATSDAPFILKLLNEQSYIQNIRDSEVRTQDQAVAFIKKTYLESYRKLGYGLYLVSTLERIPVGICGIVKRESLLLPDLGFAISELYQNKNFASEASKLVLTFAKEKLGIDEIAGITTEENLGSQKVLLRSGFSLGGKKNIGEKEFLYFHIKL